VTRNDDWSIDRPELLHAGITDKILGGFYQVHRELGFGFAESLYGPAMESVLADLGLHVEREVSIAVHFRGRQIGAFRADMVVESAVLLEFKSMRREDPAFDAQVLSYLRATRLEVALLLYFNPKPSFKRLVFANGRKFLP
jgi:GxxExxY protein